MQTYYRIVEKQCNLKMLCLGLLPISHMREALIAQKCQLYKVLWNSEAFAFKKKYLNSGIPLAVSFDCFTKYCIIVPESRQWSRALADLFYGLLFWSWCQLQNLFDSGKGYKKNKNHRKQKEVLYPKSNEDIIVLFLLHNAVLR